MSTLVTIMAFLAVPVLGMHLYDLVRKKERPLTHKVALIWLAGFTLSMVLWKATS